jgi:hypothetical protein
MARDYTESGYKVGAARLGMDPADYRRHREAGFRRCSHHARWEPAAWFRTYPQAGTRSYCVEAERIRARAWQRRLRDSIAAGTYVDPQPVRSCAQCGQAFERSSHGGLPSRFCSKACRLERKRRKHQGAA